MINSPENPINRFYRRQRSIKKLSPNCEPLKKMFLNRSAFNSPFLLKYQPPLKKVKKQRSNKINQTHIFGKSRNSSTSQGEHDSRRKKSSKNNSTKANSR